jgi:hypothetical protein
MQFVFPDEKELLADEMGVGVDKMGRGVGDAVTSARF